MITIEQITDDFILRCFYEESDQEYYIGISSIDTNERGQPMEVMQMVLTKAQFSDLCEDMETLKGRET